MPAQTVYPTLHVRPAQEQAALDLRDTYYANSRHTPTHMPDVSQDAGSFLWKVKGHETAANSYWFRRY